MSKHNYTNPAFCQGSEFYPVPSAAPKANSSSATVETIYNRSLNLNFNVAATSASASKYATNPRDGPLRIQRSMSTRSIVAHASAPMRKPPTTMAAVHISRQQLQQQQLQLQQQYELQQLQLQQRHDAAYHDTTLPARLSSKNKSRPVNLNLTAEPHLETRSVEGSGRYALVPLEDLSNVNSKRYAIVPGSSSLAKSNRRYAKSQDNLDYAASSQNDQEPHSFQEEPLSFHEQTVVERFSSLPPTLNAAPPKQRSSPHTAATPPKIKHAFSSDFGSKSFLIVDKNSNQRYQMVPTAENEELVDDNQEIIQMHNGRAHRYAVIPTEADDDDEEYVGMEDEEPTEEETCLSTPDDLNQSQQFLPMNFEPQRTPLPRTSTPQKGLSMVNLVSYPSTPLKNPAATKMLHELLSTPRKTPVPQKTPRSISMSLQREQRRLQFHQSQQQIYNASQATDLSPQRMHYETVKPVAPSAPPPLVDRTTAVIIPRVAGSGSKVYPQMVVEEDEEECSSIHDNKNKTYPQKVANATITLAVVSMMLVVGSSMNLALIIYMIAHFGKSFYLQFSLVAAFCGVGLGFLGFRSRHCEWLPNRSYTSGYILVTMFCLLKCCGLLVILVLDPYPGLPLHDVMTGVILGLSTFTMFFIGLGVIGSLWCYRPPPDNRVNVA